MVAPVFGEAAFTKEELSFDFTSGFVLPTE